MDYASLKQEIKEYAFSVGIAGIGFSSAESLPEHLPRLTRRRDASYVFAINEGDPGKRIDPRRHLTDAQSVISITVPYPATEAQLGNGGPVRGRVSFISRGRDYHDIVKSKLDQLREFIVKKIPGARIIECVDREELLEKAFAVKGGLGWFGRNTLLVTPEHGSWVCLGELITDIPFPADTSLPNGCRGCRRCIETCPTGALDEDMNLNMDRCLAALTLHKRLPEPGLRSLMADGLYGCDACQLVCPYNKKKEVPHPGAEDFNETAYPVLADILTMTKAQFKEKFGHTSGAWRGRTPFQRNAVIAAGNLRDISAVPVLINLLFNDPRPVIRSAAAWALGRMGTSESGDALIRALEFEIDADVVNEIQNASH